MNEENKEILIKISNILEALNLPELSSNIYKYAIGKSRSEAFEYYLTEWIESFEKEDFFAELGIKGTSKLIPIFEEWIDMGLIFGIKKSSSFNSLTEEEEYLIVLNETDTDKGKNPIQNRIIYKTNSKEDRDLKMSLLRDKLNFLGIKLM